MISGPSETGKTWAALWRLDALLSATPKAQAALIRKVRTTIAGTVLRTYLRVIARSGSGARAFGGNNPTWYDYPNGARLWIGGMDDPGKVLSGERDWVYVNQAEELTQDDWETLSTRTTGRGAVTKTPMLFGDCNPGPADHWILRRRDAGSLTLLESRHEDNPSLYDDAGILTDQGRRTMQTLMRLSGVRKLRLWKGQWVGAEGQFFEQWDEALHTVAPFPIPGDWPIWGAFDHGFIHPSAFGLFTGNDGRTYQIGEHVQHKWLPAQHADAMDALLDRLGIEKSRLRRIAAGHDVFQQRGDDSGDTLAEKYRKRGYVFEPALLDRINGAAELLTRLGNAEAGLPITFQVFTSCPRTISCIPRMVHDPRRPEDVLKVDADSDGNGGDDCFIAGTLITTVHGDVPIEQIVAGDMVLTRGGYRPVRAVWNSRRNADVVTATLSNGATVTATPNHRIWTPKEGWKCIDMLRYGDILLSWQHNHLKSKLSSSTEYLFDGIPSLAMPDTASITRLVASTASRVLGTFMLRYGSQRTAPFLMDTISTIKTTIHSIMTLITLNASAPTSILRFTDPMGEYGPLYPFTRTERQRSSLLALLTGIVPRKAEPGTQKISNELMRLVRAFDALVSSAAWSMNQSSVPLCVSAQTSARRSGGALLDWTLSKNHVNGVERCLPVTNTKKFDFAPVHVLDVVGTGKADTYALHVADYHEYYANGVLVKNCFDMLRYGLLQRRVAPSSLGQGTARGWGA
jgi:hypothetical protein